jgi:hypothetical protein
VNTIIAKSFWRAEPEANIMQKGLMRGMGRKPKEVRENG